MLRTLDNISKKLASNPRNAFLIDGVGAFISAILLFFLIASFEKTFGLPKKVAYQLSIPVFGFMFYSLGCYFLNIRPWKPYLKLIAVANLAYCGLTFCLIFVEFQSLTALGIVYFLAEIMVILLLVSVEWKTIKQ